jgi:hypothetical protein
LRRFSTSSQCAMPTAPDSMRRLRREPTRNARLLLSLAHLPPRVPMPPPPGRARAVLPAGRRGVRPRARAPRSGRAGPILRGPRPCNDASWRKHTRLRRKRAFLDSGHARLPAVRRGTGAARARRTASHGRARCSTGSAQSCLRQLPRNRRARRGARSSRPAARANRESTGRACSRAWSGRRAVAPRRGRDARRPDPDRR